MYKQHVMTLQQDINDKVAQILENQIMKYVNHTLPQMLKECVQASVRGAVDEIYKKLVAKFTEGNNASSKFYL